MTDEGEYRKTVTVKREHPVSRWKKIVKKVLGEGADAKSGRINA